MFSSNSMSAADYAALSNSNSWGDNSILWWILIILFLGIGNGWNNNSGASENYVLASDFATLQRQIDSTATTTQNMVSTSADQLQRQITSVADGICSLGYDQLGQINGVNTNINNAANTIVSAINADSVNNMQNTNALSSQLAGYASQTRYDALQNANTTQNLISSGFAQTNYNDASNTCAIKTQVGEVGTSLATQSATNTRDIIDAQNAGTQAILAKLNDQEMAAKQAQIDALTQQVNALTLAASQQAQNNTIISALSPTPRPAYVVANPYSSTCACSCGCA